MKLPAEAPPWFFIALGCALLTAGCDAVSKRIMQDIDEWTTGAMVLLVSGVALLPLISCMEFGPVSLDLLVVLAVTIPLEVLGYYFFLSALRLAPLSLVLPLLAFTPVLTALTAFVMLGEQIGGYGVVGIGLVTVGAYILYTDPGKFNPAAPIKAIFSSPGSRRMLMTAAIWSLTVTLGKKGILIYGAIQFGFLIIVFAAVCFGAMSLVRLKLGVARVDPTVYVAVLFVLAGVLMAGAQVTHFVSLSMAPVAYMISVKRISMVFGVIFGWLFFNESNIGYRLIASSVMVGGLFFLYQ